MKKVDIISNIVARKGEALATPSKDISKVDLSGYLLKSIWDKVWEIRTDSQGTEYIFGKLPVVTQYGITMYSGDGVDVPYLASGLPFDGRTIWYNPDTNQIEVIGGTGGGSGEGVSNFWDLSGIPSWITNSKPKYTYSEIEGTPDLTQYTTESWVNTKLGGYLPLNGNASSATKLQTARTIWGQTFDGSGNVSGILNLGTSSVRWHDSNSYSISCPTTSVSARLQYHADDGHIFKTGANTDAITILRGGNVLIGTTTNRGHKFAVYGTNTTGSITAKTLNDAVFSIGHINQGYGLSMWTEGNGHSHIQSGRTDGSGTLYNLCIQELGGNVGIGTTNPAYKLDVNGAINTSTELIVNGGKIKYDSTNKYWKLEGDLLVTGGVTMYGNEGTYTPSTIMDAIAVDGTTISKSGGVLKVIGGTSGGGLDITALQNYLTQNSYLNVTSGDNRYLKLNGGEINSTSVSPLTINTSKQTIEFQLKSNSSIKAYIGWNVTDGVFLQEGESIAYIGVQPNKTPYYFNGIRYTLWHEGNFTPSNYLPLSGGTLTGSYYSLTLKNTNEYASLIRFDNSSGELGYIGMSSDGEPWVYGKGIGNGRKIWTSANDGSGSGLDADLLDGKQPSELNVGSANILKGVAVSNVNDATGGGFFSASFQASNRPNTSVNYACGLTLLESSLNRLHQLSFDNQGNLFARSQTANGWQEWKTIAFTSSNVASATYSPNTSKLYSTDNTYSYGSAHPYYGYLTYNQTYDEWDFKVSPNTPEYIHVYSSDKLRTARTIWGQSFDGTGNIDGDFTMANAKSIQGKDSSGSSRTLLSFSSDNSLFIGRGTSGAGYATKVCGYSIQLCTNSNQTEMVRISSSGNVGIGTTSPAYKFHVVGDSYLKGVTYVGNYIAFDTQKNSVNPHGTARLGAFDRNGGIVVQFGSNTTRRQFSIIDKDWTVELFHVDDSGNVFANGGITMYSDQRKKTILNHVELSLKQIAEAPLVEHYYNSDESKTTHVGSIAQYWAKMNDWFCKLDSEGFYTMEIQNAALASAISVARELVKFENETDKRIRLLEAENKELRNEIELLKRA